ncbi:acetyl-CoA carboxylase biotin carboxylase subunit [Shewanella gelidii]|uniref:Biotin carboxylase n=1 Tax=Shewanella gelidii TaxID=1642821 RepID=A0A917K023_9GAMM|nr:acetyl-CoA carboxylase biotin carboxylase subunit [Shewanella gelidii]MCL1099599.1 acetyl-CoA carboxylase biotin carboxylase subunit [Shewanella gelidii]GGI92642.1 acetyl-CoA carboxylase biotin carboxylase subunit [Shewanella gelidii]
MMIKRVLIANRGEIALRILRACHQLGLETVAIYSSADKHQPHVRLATQSLCIGPAQSQRSYLNMEAIISAANVSGADAIHPGYGFLAENADFAQLVTGSGFTFIGPNADIIRLMGDKINAIQAMESAGIPTLPGSCGALKSDTQQIMSIAASVGYPVLIKAAGGGGGRGMRVVESEDDLLESVRLTQQEANSFFANDQVYLEKYLPQPRHIEVQVLADRQGHVFCLGDRDCSVQRRHQKLVEEAPAPDIPQNLRQALAEQCIAACQSIGYENAGTFEFLYQDDQFYFIEMNTRLQVEHTVTEQISGIDIVQAQLTIAAGESLHLTSQLVPHQGHAIECRINAEDPQTGIPCPGTITKLNIPGGLGVRWESQLYPGCEISSHYDAMVGKLICHGRTRTHAMHVMKQALIELQIEGISTNIDWHLQRFTEQLLQPN